jgi:branched-chain amino acid transport system substrate-binding protein
MRKMILAVVNLLLLLFVISHWVSLRQYSAIRGWMSSQPSGEILVGAAWPFAANQDGLDEGLILAQEEINSKGLLGKRIRLEMRDDRMDREESRKIAIDFARNPRMVATIGYYDDKFAVRASAIFEESHLLHIVAGANNSYMTSHGFRYLIRSVLSNTRIGHSLAHMCTGLGNGNYAIIYEEGAFGEDLAFQTGRELDALDRRVTYASSYVPGTVDFRDTVDELREVEADVILFLGFETESAKFIRAARGMGLKTPIVGAFSDTPEMHAVAGRALEGVMFYEIYDLDAPTPENRAFVARYRHRFGKDPEAYAPQGYDALRILAKAIETTGSTNSLDLAYAIRCMDRWEGANGSYKFDTTGELEDKRIYLKVYRGGKPVVLKTSEPADLAPAPASGQSPVPN